MSVDSFAEMVKNVRAAKIISSGPDYELTEGEKKSTVFRRSIFAVRDIRSGDEIKPEDNCIIRPGYGIKPKFLQEVIGSVATHDIQRGTPIKESDYKN